jgi:hypothetical protein
MFTKRMISTNDKHNMCRTAVKYKQRSSGTKQLELNFLTDSTSHNIYLDKYDKNSYWSTSFVKPVRFNRVGSTDILTVELSKIKCTFKNESGTYIEVLGEPYPIPVRESLSEISNLINKKENNYGW